MKKKIFRGFSLIEVMLAMSVIGILMGYISLNVLNTKNSANINTSVYTFITDFKNQQTKAMVGDTEGRGVPDNYGLYINSDKYVLFHGSTYQATDSSNFEVKVPDGIRITTTFPSSRIVFVQGTGEINSYVAGASSIIIENNRTHESKTIQINKYGIITSN